MNTTWKVIIVDLRNNSKKSNDSMNKIHRSGETTGKDNTNGNSHHVVSYQGSNLEAKSLLKENICSHQYSYEDRSQECEQASYWVYTGWEESYRKGYMLSAFSQLIL